MRDLPFLYMHPILLIISTATFYNTQSTLPLRTSLAVRQHQHLVTILGCLATFTRNAIQCRHQALHTLTHWVGDVHYMGLPATVFGGLDHLGQSSSKIGCSKSLLTT